MGLGYFLILVMIAGAAGGAVFLLLLARNIWKRSRYRALALFPLLAAGPCAAMAVWLLALFLREPPWSYHF